MSKKATLFEFTSYRYEPEAKRVVFNYKTEFNEGEPLVFTETIILPKFPTTQVPKEAMEKLLEGLHLMLGISYYKFYCAPKVKFPYSLSKKEADFWNTVYRKGLGEFFFRNKLDPKISPTFPFEKSKKDTSYSLKLSPRSLVGIGGGKDSIVAAELLKQHGFEFSGFAAETKKSPLVEKIIDIMGVAHVGMERHLDWQVHQPHEYNGHIPVSAIYAFLGVLSAVLYDYSYVVMGNEYSSSFGNITWKGMEVNHQWSKSFEFETLFLDYVKNCITPDVKYFSLLRPFYELRIVKMFVEVGKASLPYFSSCNRNFTIREKQHGGLWCGECPKCIFVWILLSAFLPKKKLISLFGKNLYQQEPLLPLFKDVLGVGTMKPFDCVGTFEEAQTAIAMAKKNYRADFIMRQIGGRAKLHSGVFSTQKENAIPENFKFLGMENALILGYGKEGKITQQYLKKYYPKLKVGIADASQGRGYLKKQEDYDIAIKTPGIQKELVTIPHTTATNMFFSKVKGKYTTIGITGSKGKSTTSSLIFNILKEAKKNVVLVGNIGKPMLGELFTPIKKDTIFLLELSSYQLDDISFSPDIAVVTNLFPEHMDFHGGLKNYYNAKKHIIHFQKENEHFVYDPDNKEMKSWLNDYRGTPIAFSKNTFKSNLLGTHNQKNIQAAASVAKLLNIPGSIITRALSKFKGLSHRLENVGTFKGITFYDDAISTTPESTILAIEAFKGKVDTIFLGGEDRGYDFSKLEKMVKKYMIQNVVLFPDSGGKILRTTKGLNVIKTKSMAEAVKFAYTHTAKGNICLLSCASPSYSLWKNFEEKGDQFKFYVKKLGKL